MDIVARESQFGNGENLLRRNRKETKSRSTLANILGEGDQQSRFVIVVVHPLILHNKLGELLVKLLSNMLEVERTLVEVFPVDNVAIVETTLYFIQIHGRTYVRHHQRHINRDGERSAVLLDKASNNINSRRLDKAKLCFLRIVDITQKHAGSGGGNLSLSLQNKSYILLRKVRDELVDRLQKGGNLLRASVVLIQTIHILLHLEVRIN